MSKSVYESRILPNLDKIIKWAEAGATAKEIAGKLHVAYSTLRKYIGLGEKGDERYAALSEAFARACEVPDEQVEAALFKRACGYQFEEVTREEKLDRDGIIHVLTKKVLRDVPPDPTSAMFWLTNRKPDRWKYRPEGDTEDGGKGRGVVLMPEVRKQDAEN